jgi:hypothetical protein
VATVSHRGLGVLVTEQELPCPIAATATRELREQRLAKA